MTKFGCDLESRASSVRRRFQHPLQMLLIFLSTLESSELSIRMASSPCIGGPGPTVPSMRPPVAPPAGLPEVPTVVEPIGAPPPLDVDPEELAVPAEFVPGVLTGFAAFPAPLESLPELPTLAGPGAPSVLPPNQRRARPLVKRLRPLRRRPTTHLRQTRRLPRQHYSRPARERRQGLAGRRREPICTRNRTSGNSFQRQRRRKRRVPKIGRIPQSGRLEHRRFLDWNRGA
jgi:hypothetical protein